MSGTKRLRGLTREGRTGNAPRYDKRPLLNGVEEYRRGVLRIDEQCVKILRRSSREMARIQRRLADRHVFPAIDISQPGTRKEERLLPPECCSASRCYTARWCR